MAIFPSEEITHPRGLIITIIFNVRVTFFCLASVLTNPAWLPFKHNIWQLHSEIAFGECVCWEAFTDWLAALMFTFSAHSLWNCLDFFIT